MSRTLPLLDDVTADASLSPCGTYRYLLSRKWQPQHGPNIVLWIMLNPSAADADVDDPTLRKVQKFARAWGYGGVLVANVYALRSSEPDDLLTHPDPVGPANDDVLTTMFDAQGIGLVVAGWGTKAGAQRVQTITGAAWKAGRTIHAVGITKGGHPQHPLYVKDEATPVLFRTAPTAPIAVGAERALWPLGDVQ